MVAVKIPKRYRRTPANAASRRSLSSGMGNDDRAPAKQSREQLKLEVETIKCTLWGVSIDGAHVRIFDLRRGDESLAITICGIPAPTPVTTGLLLRCGQQSGQE
jgi:hypothetical protein